MNRVRLAGGARPATLHELLLPPLPQLLLPPELEPHESQLPPLDPPESEPHESQLPLSLDPPESEPQPLPPLDPPESEPQPLPPEPPDSSDELHAAQLPPQPDCSFEFEQVLSHDSELLQLGPLALHDGDASQLLLSQASPHDTTVSRAGSVATPPSVPGKLPPGEP